MWEIAEIQGCKRVRECPPTCGHYPTGAGNDHKLGEYFHTLPRIGAALSQYRDALLAFKKLPLPSLSEHSPHAGGAHPSPSMLGVRGIPAYPMFVNGFLTQAVLAGALFVVLPEASHPNGFARTGFGMLPLRSVCPLLSVWPRPCPYLAGLAAGSWGGIIVLLHPGHMISVNVEPLQQQAVGWARLHAAVDFHYSCSIGHRAHPRRSRLGVPNNKQPDPNTFRKACY